MMGENQRLLNTLVSISSSSPLCPAWIEAERLDQPVVRYSTPFETDFWVAQSFFSASDISFLA